MKLSDRTERPLDIIEAGDNSRCALIPCPFGVDLFRGPHAFGPRFAGMPIHPVHRPGYFYALHRRHKDGYQPKTEGPRTGASGVITGKPTPTTSWR